MRTRTRWTAFWAVWAVGSLWLGWQVTQGQRAFAGPATSWALLMGLACTAVLLWAVHRPFPKTIEPPGAATATWWRVIPAGLALFGGLVAVKEVFGPRLLFALPVIAAVVLISMRRSLSRRTIVYASILAAAATTAGLGAGWIRAFPLPVWAALQTGLVLPGLLAGWAMLQRTGLFQAGAGASVYLSMGIPPALKAFAVGIALSVPWALLNIAVGGAADDAWVRHWWQPLVAVQPAISEEAWGRVLLIPLAYVGVRRFGRPRFALLAAVLAVGYWFAYLHTDSGVLSGLISAALIGTLFALPVSFLWLYRGLETAIGFHFAVDFLRFLAAYLMNEHRFFS